MDQPAWNILFRLNRNVSRVFPYINGLLKGALYFENPHHIQFFLNGTGCGLYPERAVAGHFPGREEALAFAWSLIDFINEVDERKGEINPSHRKFKHVPTLEVFKILPRTNCRKCGYLTCMAFAAAVSTQQARPDQCPEFSRPITTTVTYPVYDTEGRLVSTINIETENPGLSVPSSPEQEKAKPQPVETPYGETLTGREMEVLGLLAQGHTNGEISQSLSISPHTVKSHVIHIFNKLGVNDRTQAAVWAAKNCLV